MRKFNERQCSFRKDKIEIMGVPEEQRKERVEGLLKKN